MLSLTMRHERPITRCANPLVVQLMATSFSVTDLSDTC